MSQIPGVTRILTRSDIIRSRSRGDLNPDFFDLRSGGGRTAPESISVLRNLLRLSRSPKNSEQDRTITILPGSGINGKTIQSILTLLPEGLEEVHLSGATWLEGSMQYRVEGMGMGVGGAGDWGIWCTQTANIEAVCDQISMVVS
jgi:copper homeostasis protein